VPVATRTLDLLDLLDRHRVEHVVVGMTAAVLQGAPAVTFDLDVVYRRTPENIDRLLRALAEIDAVFRGDRRGIRPSVSHLASPGHKLLTTHLGDFDVLGAIGDGLDFDALLPDCVTLDLGSYAIRVLGLPKLIEVKTAAGREKDLAVLPLLRAALKRSEGV
jgi:hypothetical protein